MKYKTDIVFLDKDLTPLPLPLLTLPEEELGGGGGERGQVKVK